MKIERLVAVSILAGCLSPPAASASFLVSPMEVKWETERGGKNVQGLTISNTGERPLTLKLYLADSRFLPDGKEESLPPGSHDRSCAPWMRVAEPVVDLEPGEVRVVDLFVAVPEEADGSFWAKVYVEEASVPEPVVRREGERTYHVFMKQRIGVRVYEDVVGTRHPEARVAYVHVPVPESRPGTGEKSPPAVVPASAGAFAIQLVATRSETKAESIAASVRERNTDDVRVIEEGGWYKVRVGGGVTLAETRPVLAEARGWGFPKAWIVAVGRGAAERADAHPAEGSWKPSTQVVVENTGNCVLRCRGRVEMRDASGETVVTLPLGDEGAFTLFPGGRRDLEVRADEPPPPGTYTALAIVDFGGDYLVAGDATFVVHGGEVASRAGGS